jgi:hypothetical protein
LRNANKAASAAKVVEAEARVRRNHDPHALKQPEEPPTVDESLVGKLIEVLSEIEEPKVGDEGKEVLDDEGDEVMVYSKQWLPAEVAKFSTGDDKKKEQGGSQHEGASWVGAAELRRLPTTTASCVRA